MKPKQLHTLLLAGAATLSGLTAGAAEWSLDSCISYAISHNINVRAKALDAASARLDITEAKDRFLPQLEASQTFNFGRGLTSENTYADRNTKQFGWNVGLSLPLFQGLSAKRQLDYAKANMNAVLESAEAGKISELDLTQARSQLAQDRLTAVTTDNDHRMALVDLARLLQLPDVENFEIAPLSDADILIPEASTVYSNAVENNHAVKAAGPSRKAAEKSISLARSGYLPRLSLNAGLGSSYYNISGISNAPFHRQMRDNFNKSIGFSLSVPIFDAFTTRNSVRKAEIRRLNAELQLEDTRTSLYNDIRQAYWQAKAALAKKSAAITAREAAREALAAMEEKYNYGRANATEFEEAKSTYIKASSEALQAKYEALLRMRILDFYNRR